MAEEFQFGSQAGRLPAPAEVLPQLDPRRIISGKRHLLAVPGRTDCIVRIDPHVPATDHNRTLIELTRSRVFNEYRALAIAGQGRFRLPSMRMLICDNLPPNLRQRFDYNQGGFQPLALVTATEYIANTELRGNGDPRGIGPVLGLLNYTQGLITDRRNPHRFYLMDIYKPPQWLGDTLADIGGNYLARITRRAMLMRLDELSIWHDGLTYTKGATHPAVQEIGRRVTDLTQQVTKLTDWPAQSMRLPAYNGF